MSYGREWADRRNAAGFAAECARLALPLYKGDRRQDLVTAIELAERYVSGEEITAHAAYAASSPAYAASRDADAASYAAATAAYATASLGGAAADAASYAAALVAASDTAYAAAACINATHAGVDTHELQIAFARWAVRDLSGGRDLSAELRQAAGAAVVAGDEAFAKELLNTSQHEAV